MRYHNIIGVEMKALLTSLWIVIFSFALVLFGNTESNKKSIAKNQKSESQLELVPYATYRDARFVLIQELRLTVPNSYNHQTELGSFENENRDNNNQNVTSAFSDEVLTSTAAPLIPGKTYTVRIFSFAKDISYQDCQEFILRHNVICVGAPGIALLSQVKKDAFPKEKITLAFGDYDVIASEKGKNNVSVLPFVAVFHNKKVGIARLFALMKIQKSYSTDFCLLCFYDE